MRTKPGRRSVTESGSRDQRDIVAAIHGGPPNACVGPRVLYAPENKLRSTQGAHVLEYCA